MLYRRPSASTSFVAPELFTLVTDATFAKEGRIVWESLEDVDGSASDFFDGGLARSTGGGGIAGGDYVGRESSVDAGRGSNEVVGRQTNVEQRSQQPSGMIENPSSDPE